MQKSVPNAAKIDAPLAELCFAGLAAPSERMPIVVRYTDDALESIIERILELGGSIRHQLAFIHAVAAWLPLQSVDALSNEPSVSLLELEQEFKIM